MVKRLIAILVFVAVTAYGQSRPVWWDGSNLFTYTNSAAQTNTVTLDSLSVDNLTSTNVVLSETALSRPAYATGYLKDRAQVFTAAAGYEIITNYTAGCLANMGTLTDSNLAVKITGDYLFSASLSMDSSAAATSLHAHAYTNGAQVVQLGAQTYLATAGAYGNMSINGCVHMSSNDYIDVRLDSDKDATVSFDHADATLILLKQD